MANVGILVDLEYCVGCYGCQSACNDYHHLPLGETYLKQCNLKPHKVDGDLSMFMCPIPYRIEKCAECLEHEEVAPCQAICISKSLWVDEVDNLLAKARELGTRTVLFQPRLGA